MDTILNELKEVPADRLDDLYSIIHSFRMNNQKKEKSGREILSFSGAFADMSTNDFEEFQNHLQDTRKDLFSREAT